MGRVYSARKRVENRHSKRWYTTLQARTEVVKDVARRPLKTRQTPKGVRHAIYPSGLPDPLPGVNPKRDDPDLLNRLGLTWTEDMAQDFRQSIPTYHAKARPTRDQYPANGEWLVETPRAKARLERYTEIVSRADARSKKPTGILMLDPPRFNKIVEPHESIQVCDPVTGEVQLVVIRDFVGDLDVLAEMDAAAEHHIEIGRDIRVSLLLLLLLHRHYWSYNISNVYAEGRPGKHDTIWVHPRGTACGEEDALLGQKRIHHDLLPA